jgi:hypothetical protein
MPTRYSQSSTYPTGRAPLAVDLSQQYWNIAQERVKARKQEIEENDLKISENEKFLLKAFDIETVKGAQDKKTVELAKMLDDHLTKWAFISKNNEKPGILTTEQKFEVLRDRREIEDARQKAASEVAQYEQLAKDAVDPKKRELYDPQTFIDMGKYAAEGRIGDGKLINLIKYAPQAIGQDFMAEVQGMAKEMGVFNKQLFKQYPTGIVDNGQTQWGYTNKPTVETLKKIAQTLPSFHALAKDNYGQAMQILNSIDDYTIDISDYEPIKSGSAAGGKTSAQIKAEKDQNEKFGSFNNIALNLMDMDEAQVTKLKSAEPGKIRDIYYEQSPDGATDMFIEYQPESTGGTKLARGIEKIRLPKDANDKEGIDLFYSKLHQVLPTEMKQGVDVSDIPKTIKSRAGKYTGNKLPIRTIQKIETTLNTVITNPKKGIFKAAADSINTWMKNINPKAPKLEGTKEGFKYGEEGNQKEYNFVNPPKGTVNTPEDLRKKIELNINAPKVGNPNAPEAESSAPVTRTFDIGGEKYYIPENMVTEFLKDNPNAKKVE